MRAIRRFDYWMAASPLRYASLVVLASVIVMALFVDLPLLVYLVQSGFRFLVPLLDAIGELGRAEYWVAAALLVYAGGWWWRERRTPGERRLAQIKRAQRHALHMLAGLAATGAIIHILKAFVGRPRPVLYFESSDYGVSGPLHGYPLNSFPSGHTQVAFTVAVVIAMTFPQLRLPAFFIAGLIGFSRLANGAHYLSDVVASAFICIVVTTLIGRVLLDPKRIWPDISPRKWIQGRWH